jgi:Outer membrane protein beta-barrel domain
MKPFYVVAILLLSGLNALRAQDLIVTSKGDSVNCLITKVSKEHIYFVYKNGEKATKTLMPVNQVTSHKKKYFDHSALPAQTVRAYGDYPKFRLSFQGGWSYRVAKVADVGDAALKEYIKGLKSGFHLGVDGAFFFTENYGAGLKYAYFNAKNEIGNVTVTTSTGESKTGLMRDKVNIHYFAPEFWSRYFFADDKLVLLAGASIGYLRYNDNAVLVDPLTISGGTVGLGFDIGLDYMITPHFGIGANLGLIGGSIGSLKYNDGTGEREVNLDDNQRENLTRLDVSAGVRWCF